MCWASLPPRPAPWALTSPSSRGSGPSALHLPAPSPASRTCPPAARVGLYGQAAMGAAWAPRCPPAACRDGGSAQSGVCLPGQVGLWRKAEFLPGAQGGAGLGIGGRVSQGQGTESRVSVGTAHRPESGALSTRICQRVTLRPGGGRIGFRVACLPCAFTGREEEARGCFPRGDRGRAEQGFISQGRPWAPGVMMRMLGALGPSCTSVWGDTSHEGLSSAHPASPLSGGSQQGFVIDSRVDHPWMDRAEGGLEPGPSGVGAQAGPPVEPSASAHPRPPAPTGQLLRKSQASTAGGGARGSASPSRGPGRPSGDTK